MPLTIPYIATTVDVQKTLSEIEAILQVHGVSAIAKEYESGRIRSLAFKHDGVPFQLPARVENLYQYLLKTRQETPRYRYSVLTQEQRAKIFAQAERCAWRNVMACVKAQLALVEIGMVTVTEVFLPYMLTDGQETLYQQMVARGLRALPAPHTGGSANG